MDIEEFKELGLTGNEAKVYSTLVERGKMSAGSVSSASGVSYSRIYDILESLTHKGLIVVVPEKTKKYIPGNPEAFIKLLEEKEKVIARAKEKVKELKRFYDVKEKNPVEMGMGIKSFYKIVSASKTAEKYDYSVKWTSEFRPEWVESQKKKLKKGVDVKVLARHDKETLDNVKSWLKINKNIKSIQNDGLAMSIVDDEEVMLGLIRSNITLLIRNKDFAKIMKRMFLDSYNAAEEIK
jgi:sugar-specific transcriptional regulator TrmB